MKLLSSGEEAPIKAVVDKFFRISADASMLQKQIEAHGRTFDKISTEVLSMTNRNGWCMKSAFNVVTGRGSCFVLEATTKETRQIATKAVSVYRKSLGFDPMELCLINKLDIKHKKQLEGLIALELTGQHYAAPSRTLIEIEQAVKLIYAFKTLPRANELLMA